MNPTDYLNDVLFNDARSMLQDLQFIQHDNMSDLPLDPESMPGTQEHEEWQIQRRRRARRQNPDWDNVPMEELDD